VEAEDEDFINQEETPIIELCPSMPICFSTEQSPSLFSETFRGKISDVPSLEVNIIPPWIVDWIVKVSFC
jgi:hypothetical protein